jgi:SAM-dependent methyltransferase
VKLEKIINLEDRCCDVCGSRDLETLWSYNRRVATHNFYWTFEVNNKICKNCGFVFVSPVYSSSDLAEYYKDSYPNFGNGDFDSAVRISLIETLPLHGGAGELPVFLKIGSNNIGDFQKYLSSKFQYKSIELNASTTKSGEFTSHLESKSADIVAHYFVLEHVAQPIEFMREANRVLKEGGVMVCEIPDISAYPSNPAALMLYEHVNHFSRSALVELAERAGFQLIRYDDTCSRPFGFSAVFAKRNTGHAKTNSPNRESYFLNKKLFEGGMDLVRVYESNLKDALQSFQHHMSSKNKVVLWVANSITNDFINLLGGEIDENLVCVVDSNPQKQKYFSSFPVYTPAQVGEFICKAHAIYIFSNYYASSILDEIKTKLGKTFDADCVYIFSMPKASINVDHASNKKEIFRHD